MYTDDIKGLFANNRHIQEEIGKECNPIFGFRLYADGCYVLEYADSTNEFYTSSHKRLVFDETPMEIISYHPEARLVFTAQDKDEIINNYLEVWDLENNYLGEDPDLYVFRLEIKFRKDLEIIKKNSKFVRDLKEKFPLAKVQEFGQFVAVLKENMFFRYDLKNLYNTKASLFRKSDKKIQKDFEKINGISNLDKYYGVQYLDLLMSLKSVQSGNYQKVR